jgi:hypothetical protein
VCTDSGKDDFHPLAKCAENFHVVNHACTACAGNKTNAAGDDPNTAVNTYCDDAPGAKLKLKTSACATNEHVVDHQCLACPVGTTNRAGDDPHYFDTACTAEICAENFRVKCTPPTTVDGVTSVKSCTCVACEGVRVTNNQPNGGTTALTGANVAGDAAASGILLTNTAGDDCSKGVDTFCV